MCEEQIRFIMGKWISISEDFPLNKLYKNKLMGQAFHMTSCHSRLVTNGQKIFIGLKATPWEIGVFLFNSSFT